MEETPEADVKSVAQMRADDPDLPDNFPKNLDAIQVNLHLTRQEYADILTLAQGYRCSLSDAVRQGGLESLDKDTGPMEGEEHEGITVIAWVNKPELWQNLVLGSMHPKMGFQRVRKNFDIQFIEVPPSMRYKNIGEAYEAARRQARHKLCVYIHQDAYPCDWLYLEKVWLAHRSGIQATGVIGYAEETGGAWFHGEDPGKMSGFIDISSGRIIGYTDMEVAVVDALVFSCSADLPWSTEYEGPHMAVEDMCMQVRAGGGQVWNLSTQFMHLSPGSTDEAFWRSVETFRTKWADRLPTSLPSLSELQERTYRERNKQGLGMDGRLTPEGQKQVASMRAASKRLMDSRSMSAEESDAHIAVLQRKQEIAAEEAKIAKADKEIAHHLSWREQHHPNRAQRRAAQRSKG